MTDANELVNLNPDGAGYGKPPKKTRFKKGQSGNPKGRPKGSLNLATVLAKTLREKVVINESGRRKKITKMELVTKQLANKAGSGDVQAMRLLMALVVSAEESAARAPLADAALSEADEKVMQRILERFEKDNKGEDDDETDLK